MAGTDVDVGAVHKQWQPLGRALDQAAAGVHPHPVAGLVAHAQDAVVVGQGATEVLFQLGLATLQVFGVGELDPGVDVQRRQFFQVVAEHGRPARIEYGGTALYVPLPGAEVGALDNAVQALALLAQGLFNAFALADVADHAVPDDAAVGLRLRRGAAFDPDQAALRMDNPVLLLPGAQATAREADAVVDAR